MVMWKQCTCSVQCYENNLKGNYFYVVPGYVILSTHTVKGTSKSISNKFFVNLGKRKYMYAIILLILVASFLEHFLPSWVVILEWSVIHLYIKRCTPLSLKASYIIQMICKKCNTIWNESHIEIYLCIIAEILQKYQNTETKTWHSLWMLFGILR